MSSLFSRVVNFVSRIGVEPTDSAETRAKKAIFSRASLVGVGSLIFWSLPMFAFGEPRAGLLWLLYAFLLLSTLFIWAVTHKGYQITVFIQVSSLLIFPFLLSVIIGTFTNFGGAWYALTAVMAALVFFPHRFWTWCLAAAATVVVSLGLEAISSPTSKFPPLLFSIQYGAGFLTLGGIAVFMLYNVLRQRDAAYQLLRGEQEKSENLLLNILPSDIATLLKDKQHTIADQHTSASVLFADVVNFTPISAQMSPVGLVELLNEVFSYFDTLVEKYDLEKIKTIGDCYMVASGVPRARPDHAQVLARMALEMQDYTSRNEFCGRSLMFRMGLNSGPVVAGVIGRKKFIYDLWGDAVNTASRMESHGRGGCVQITRATYDLVKDEFICESQGTMTIKGKGEMEIWHIIGSLAT